MAAHRIISGKGATHYGIGACIARVVRAIQDDEQMVFALSAPAYDDKDLDGVCLSLPRVCVGARRYCRNSSSDVVGR